MNKKKDNIQNTFLYLYIIWESWEKYVWWELYLNDLEKQTNLKLNSIYSPKANLIYGLLRKVIGKDEGKKKSCG